MPFMNKKLHELLSENENYFKSPQGTDGND